MNHQRLSEAEEHLPKGLALVPYQDVPDAAISRFFELQEQIEKDLSRGGMDYFRFSKELWKCFFKEDPDIENPQYREFEAIIVLGLQKLTTRELIYPDIKRNLVEILHQLYPIVERVVLWSRGDVHNSGYQMAKMELSGLKTVWLRGLLGAGKEKARSYIRDKTSIIINEEKDSPLRGLVESVRPQKLVVVEDSLKNLERTRTLAEEHCPETLKRVDDIIDNTRSELYN